MRLCLVLLFQASFGTWIDIDLSNSGFKSMQIPEAEIDSNVEDLEFHPNVTFVDVDANFISCSADAANHTIYAALKSCDEYHGYLWPRILYSAKTGICDGYDLRNRILNSRIESENGTTCILEIELMEATLFEVFIRGKMKMKTVNHVAKKRRLNSDKRKSEKTKGARTLEESSVDITQENGVPYVNHFHAVSSSNGSFR